MEVKIGVDGLIFESRSFSHYGAQSLLNTFQEPQPEYRPDFSAWPATDCLVVIVTQQQYIAICKASNFEKRKYSGGSNGGGGEEDGRMSTEPNDVFNDEWAKAESSDLLEASRSDCYSGLAPISKFLSKNLLHGNRREKTSKERKMSDQVELLSGTGSSSLPSSTVELQELGQVLAPSNNQIKCGDDMPDLEAGVDSDKYRSRMFRTSPKKSN